MKDLQCRSATIGCLNSYKNNNQHTNNKYKKINKDETNYNNKNMEYRAEGQNNFRLMAETIFGGFEDRSDHNPSLELSAKGSFVIELI